MSSHSADTNASIDRADEHPCLPVGSLSQAWKVVMDTDALPAALTGPA
jgi:hypothetical protein